MTKITIDVLPERPIAYLDSIPNSIEANLFEGNNKVFSVGIAKPVLQSELEELVGRFLSHQSFAVFNEPKEMNCPGAFSSALVPNLDIISILEKIEKVQSSDFAEQEDIEQLRSFFLKLYDLEELYQKILANLRKLQKG